VSIPGTYVVTYQAIDTAGNAAAPATRTVIVQDTTPPAITMLGTSPVTVEVGTEYLDAGATAWDTCDGDLTANIVTTNLVEIAVLGTYSVAYDVNDSAGNAALTVTRIVHVVDTTPPDLICLGNQTVAPLDCDYHVVFEECTAMDNYDPQPSVTCTPSSGSVLGPGTHTVTCVATDASGNTSTCSFTVTVLQALQVIFEAPLEDDNMRDEIETDLDVANRFKVGQTIPVKVKVLDCSGNDVTATLGTALTVRIDTTEREDQGTASTLVSDIPEDFNGVGEPESVMVLMGDHFQYNLDTDGLETGTFSDPNRFFRVLVNVEYNTDPGIVVGTEDALLESK
jgi:hypothetical protein